MEPASHEANVPAARGEIRPARSPGRRWVIAGIGLALVAGVLLAVRRCSAPAEAARG